MPQSLPLIAGRRVAAVQGSHSGARALRGRRRRTSIALPILGVVACAGALAAQEGAPPYPAVVLDSMIARGQQVYVGGSGCARCHGELGGGTSEGPDLTDDVWLRGSGRYEEILELVRHGISRREARTQKPMPIGGWEPLGDEAARAVAAYVWSISRQAEPGS
jgi:mono/diheme cytochrome c family protein